MASQRLSERELIEAGRRTILRVGLEGATLERIADEAGVSRVTLHRRGITKQQIVSELTEQALEDYRRAVWPAMTGAGTGAERLEQALEALCSVAERHLELLVALGSASDAVFHEEGEDEALTRGLWTDPLQRLLRDGIGDGSLRGLDPAPTATVIFNLVGWTYIHLRRGHGWRPERAQEATLDVALRGLVAAGSTDD